MSFVKESSPISDETTYKVAVVGNGGVGKSALTIQFVQGYFVTDYDPTIEDSYVKQCTVDNAHYKLNVMDTAGQEEFQAMRDSYMKFGDGFLLVFSLIDRYSMEAIKNFYKQILRVKDRDEYPMVLVANKCDISEQAREVSNEMVKNLAKELHCHYIETSAKQCINVEQAFYDLIKLMKRFQEMERPSITQTTPRKKKKSTCAIL